MKLLERIAKLEILRKSSAGSGYSLAIYNRHLRDAAPWLLAIAKAAVAEYEAGQVYIKLDLAKLDSEKSAAERQVVENANRVLMGKSVELASAIILAKLETDNAGK